MRNDKMRDLILQRKQKIAALRAEGVNPFPNDFNVAHTVSDILNEIAKFSGETDQDAPFTAAGRIMAINGSLL